MLAKGTQNRPGLTIDCLAVLRFAAIFDSARSRIEANTIIDHLASCALQLRKKTRHRLRIAPHMRAGAWAAAHPFPSVESVGSESIAGCGSQDRDVGESPFEEPLRKGSLIPGIMPEERVCPKPVEVLIDVAGDGPGIGKPRSIVAAAFSALDATEL